MDIIPGARVGWVAAWITWIDSRLDARSRNWPGGPGIHLPRKLFSLGDRLEVGSMDCSASGGLGWEFNWVAPQLGGWLIGWPFFGWATMVAGWRLLLTSGFALLW